jgi:hypothetical protein
MRNRPVDKKVDSISWELEAMEKGNYPFYMLKEIHEQVVSIPRAMSGRIDEDQATAVLGGLNMSENGTSRREKSHDHRCGNQLLRRTGGGLSPGEPGPNTGCDGTGLGSPLPKIPSLRKALCTSP